MATACAVWQVMIPGEKRIYRLYNAADQPLVDLITRASEKAPTPGERILIRHPFQVRHRQN